jgi:hypothetical protein
MLVVINVLEGETAEDALRYAPVSSEMFKRSMAALHNLAAAKEMSHRQYAAAAHCYGIIYDRFGRDPKAFGELARGFGACAAVCLFLGAIQIHDDGPADDRLAVVNAFAYDHFAVCLDCRRKYHLAESVEAAFADNRKTDARPQ